jgi:hypothetical protein
MKGIRQARKLEHLLSGTTSLVAACMHTCMHGLLLASQAVTGTPEERVAAAAGGYVDQSTRKLHASSAAGKAC